MALTVTSSCICDACNKLINHSTKVLEEEDGVDVSRAVRVFGQDLCKDCRQLAMEAVQAALEPVILLNRGRRTS